MNRGISAENTPDTTVAIVKVSAVTRVFTGTITLVVMNVQ